MERGQRGERRKRGGADERMLLMGPKYLGIFFNLSFFQCMQYNITQPLEILQFQINSCTHAGPELTLKSIRRGGESRGEQGRAGEGREGKW